MDTKFILGLSVAIVILAINLSGWLSMNASRISLIIAWLLFGLATFTFKPIIELSYENRIIITLLILALLGGGMIILDKKMNRKRKRKDDPNDKKTPDILASQSVISINQQGGQTAGTIINLGPSQRQIQGGTALGRLTPFSGMKVFFHWRADDAESCKFRDELAQFLNAAGWQVTFSGGHIADESFSNVILEIKERQEPADRTNAAALTLEEILKNNLITVTVRRNPASGLPLNAMYIRIGPIK